MTAILMTIDYERLVVGEFERAGLCLTELCRTRHLDRAAAYARLARGAAEGSRWPSEVIHLLGTLSAALDDADDMGLTMAAIRIDEAIEALGGIGRPPPD